MRHRYLVCYDIMDDKRLRRVHKKMLGFGDPVQYSVFKCDLNDTERALMIATLNELINVTQDRVMIVRLGPVDSLDDDRVEFLGAPMAPWERPVAIII